MEPRNDLTTDAIAEERRKVEQKRNVVSRCPGYWTDSSTDLSTGLEVVELTPERQWADTMPFEMEPLERRTQDADR